MRTIQEIVQDNDLFRTTLLVSLRHRIVLTNTVACLRERDPKVFSEIIHMVSTFKDFNEDNDPYGEHDFGSFEVGGISYFWKIDYYAAGWEAGVDPKEEIPHLLLTIMAADDY